MGHTVYRVAADTQGWTVEYRHDTTGATYAVLVPRAAVANRMGAYGITNPRQALLAAIHDYHWITTPRDPRDDPALVAGYVTSTGPDAEPIALYRAASGADAAGAYLTRTAVCAHEADLRDPDGLLPDHIPDPAEVRHHREMTDTMRWHQMYGGLPQPPRARTPITPGGPRA